jgi:hypothetical protein
LDFDWADYQFVELQSSEGKINRGLDLWLAAALERDGADSIPWDTADDMYATIDSIREGSAVWQTVFFQYNGPMPPNPPQWMLKTYELNTHNTLLVMEQQLATTAFENETDYVPYKLYDAEGNRVYSNLMSGRWAYKEAVRDFQYICVFVIHDLQDSIAKDAATHGAMLVPGISGSDKCTSSNATGHQEYHPMYAGPGNITNAARRGHGNGILPVAFLPIPKGII